MNTQAFTPETDDFYCNPPETEPAYQFARQLERERNEAIRERDSLHKLHNDNSKRHAELLELCRTLRQERDEARRELELAEDLIVRMSDSRKPLRETSNKLP